jgi:hypothetical protein
MYTKLYTDIIVARTDPKRFLGFCIDADQFEGDEYESCMWEMDNPIVRAGCYGGDFSAGITYKELQDSGLPCSLHGHSGGSRQLSTQTTIVNQNYYYTTIFGIRPVQWDVADN